MVDKKLIEDGIGLVLKGLGVDLADRNYVDTPKRVAGFYKELFDTKEVEYSTFPEDYSDFILLKGHRMFGLCCHHLIPVEFTVDLAYIPDGHVLGLSKLARIFDECNRGPLLQERFTKDVLETLQTNVPGIKGAACLIDGQHGCTKVRGVKSDGRFTTYRLSGVFKDDSELESRFFQLARR